MGLIAAVADSYQTLFTEAKLPADQRIGGHYHAKPFTFSGREMALVYGFHVLSDKWHFSRKAEQLKSIITKQQVLYGLTHTYTDFYERSNIAQKRRARQHTKVIANYLKAG